MNANIFIIGGVAIGCVRVVVYRVLEALFVCVDFGHVVCLIGLEGFFTIRICVVGERKKSGIVMFRERVEMGVRKM